MSDQTNLDKCVDELHLSVRLSNILENTARDLPEWARKQRLPPPKTLGDIVQWSKDNMLRLTHMGSRTIVELEEVLASEGVALSPHGVSDDTAADTTLRATNLIVQSLRHLPKADQARSLIAAATILGHEDLVKRS